ncbi:MAG: dTDP-4-dehydrorhamnose reductase [Oscillospiraceae bacterium]|nr:dTDP-4-dehydrorhamnose reductase [Oscillospiraceae bacterium]
MRILITGCRGQLGTELQRQLAEGGSALGPLEERLQNSDVTAVDIDSFDLADREAVLAFLDEGSYDMVINCAAFTNVNACESEQDAAFAANALGPRNLAEACASTSTALMHVSTDYVFDGLASEPYREYDLPSPITVYGKTKLAGELAVRERCANHYIIRTAWLYGAKGTNFVKTILKLAREKDEIKVVNDQLGNPTNAVDLAHHMLKIAPSSRYGVYHCTGAGVCSWYDFASEIVRLSGLECRVIPCTTEEYPTPAKRPAFSALDNMMLRLTAGDEMRGWREALADYMAAL